MALDTRGFADGALRGFEVMDNYYRRQHSLKQADEQMTMARENQAMSLKAHDQQMKLAQERSDRERSEFDAKYGTTGEDGKRVGGWLAKQQAQQGKVADAQLAASQSRQKLSDYQFNQAQKTNYIRDNLPLVQNAWKQYNDSGEVDPVLDNEYIRGSAYDPRRYLSKKVNRAFDVIESKLPQIAQGQVKSDDADFVSALGVMYENQVKASVGQQDPITGKTIKDVKLGGVHLAKDIDPNQPGEQPGIVLTTMVNYGDDGKWVAKPVTNNRSTDLNDTVKVIPLERAMKDITSQLALRRQAASSDAYKQVFGKSRQNQSKYDDAIVALEKEKMKAIAQVLSPESEAGQKQIMAINAQFDASVQNLQQRLLGEQRSNARTTQVPQWAGGNPVKIKFARALQANGYDVGQMSTDDLDDAWKAERESRLAADNSQLVGQYKNRGSAGADNAENSGQSHLMSVMGYRP
ncbi:hypothetical protein [Vibrio sp. MEBiC08052]|uniref:hypothetical protein n=1 Tax=Vibrio sp. MEBiC08052 TaxID=1761910 RepID=UPI0007405803|nr:hypothetical protein [Vibrio sp. MEBiC08052]KUI98934.1 hypothetical protein VRK_19350 [Vibrio sp. MEBiC08052]